MRIQPPPERVLVVRLSALGDVVNCLPALEALRRLWPAAQIDWLTEPVGAGLLAGHPALEFVHVLPRKRWLAELRSPRRWLALARESLAFARRLRRRRYDLLIDLQGNSRSLALSALARSRKRITHARSEVKELAHLFAFSPPAAGRVVRARKHLNVIRWLGWEGEESELHVRLPEGPPLSPPARRGRPLVYVHPFVSRHGHVKTWPVRHFASLGASLLQSGCDVVYGWGPGERRAAADLAALTGADAQVAPELETIQKLVAYLRGCDVVVAADTGPLHLAAAAGCRVVALFGPKDPEVYAPYAAGEQAAGRISLLRAPIPCSPCNQRRCEHRICMELVSPTRVRHAVWQAIRGGSAPGSAKEAGLDPDPVQ